MILVYIRQNAQPRMRCTQNEIDRRHDLNTSLEPSIQKREIIRSPLDLGDGLCEILFLMLDKDPMESVMHRPVKAEIYDLAVETINNLNDEGPSEGIMNPPMY